MSDIKFLVRKDQIIKVKVLSSGELLIASQDEIPLEFKSDPTVIKEGQKLDVNLSTDVIKDRAQGAIIHVNSLRNKKELIDSEIKRLLNYGFTLDEVLPSYCKPQTEFEYPNFVKEVITRGIPTDTGSFIPLNSVTNATFGFIGESENKRPYFDIEVGDNHFTILNQIIVQILKTIFDNE